MLVYILKRLLYLILTFLIVSVLVFFLVRKAMPDPINQMLSLSNQSSLDKSETGLSLKKKIEQKHHLDLPIFYIEVEPFSLGIQTRNDVEIWHHFVPKVSWTGSENQYHLWLKRAMIGDFGTSFQDGRPILSSIGDRVFYTLLFSSISLFITYFFSFRLALFVSRLRIKAISTFTTSLLFLLQSIPVFWLAAILIYWISNNVPGFPVFGVHQWSSELSFAGNMVETIRYMSLPLFCWTYSSFAFIYFQFKAGLNGELVKDYVRTAFSKGASEKDVIRKHVVKNALVPLITIGAEILPKLIGGSVLIEVIFAVPGLGKFMYDGIVHQDYPVILAVVLFSSFLVLLSYLISDLLYMLVDPRIKKQFLSNEK